MIRNGAVVGFGTIAETTHLGALAAAGMHVVAVVETADDRCAEVLRALPYARIYRDVAQLLAHEKLDFVDICTPPHAHYKAACAAMEAGVHVLCEKPLVLLPEHAAELARLAELHQTVVGCVHNWTQAPILKRARELALGGTLGALQRVNMVTLRTKPAAVAGDTSNWRVDPSKAGGGILFDHGWHGMSILLRSVGAAPRYVRGRCEKRRFTDLPVEDSSETWVEFENGVIGRYEATWAGSERRNRVSLQCERGRIEVDNDTLKIFDHEALLDTTVFAESLAGGGYRPDWTAAIVQEFKNEIDVTASRGALLSEALTTLQMLLATYASSAQGGQAMRVGSDVSFFAQYKRAQVA